MEKKGSILVIEKVNYNHFWRATNEEHYWIIQKPGSIYIGHVSPWTGFAKNITNSITSFLSEADFSLDELDLIGWDGTASNTG